MQLSKNLLVKRNYKAHSFHIWYIASSISPDKAHKGVIYTPKTRIYVLVGISERTLTR